MRVADDCFSRSLRIADNAVRQPERSAPAVTKLFVTDLDDRVHDLDVEPGVTLMEAVTRGGILGMDAICGGACACATCRVNVDEAWTDRLPAAQEDEVSMLEYSGFETPGVRLSCQIKVTDEIAGLKITLSGE